MRPQVTAPRRYLNPLLLPVYSLVNVEIKHETRRKKYVWKNAEYEKKSQTTKKNLKDVKINFFFIYKPVSKYYRLDL